MSHHPPPPNSAEIETSIAWGDPTDRTAHGFVSRGEWNVTLSIDSGDRPTQFARTYLHLRSDSAREIGLALVAQANAFDAEQAARVLR